jgi:translation elongation factor EF-Tu-like GTPase
MSKDQHWFAWKTAIRKWQRSHSGIDGEVDRYIPQPDRPKDKPFLMPMKTYSQFSRGTVFTGGARTRNHQIGDEIEIVGIKPTAKTNLHRIEMFANF